MPRQRPVIHRGVMRDVLAEYQGKPVHLHVPMYTLAALRRAYPAGHLRCGSCGELQPLQDMLDKMEERWGPDRVVTYGLSHDYYPDDPCAQDQTSAGKGQFPAQCLVLYSDGVREEYALNEDGRYEWLYGIVFRDARSPDRVYREVWYPTGEFRAPEEVPRD